MSFNRNMGTITVGNVTYHVEEDSISLGTKYTLDLDGEPVFEGLEGRVEMEEYDMEIFNPREDSNVGVMAVNYRGYDLGDEDISDIDFQIECDRCGGMGEQGVLIASPPVGGTLREVIVNCAKCKGDGTIDISPIDYFKQERGARVVLPLIVYEHSGITMQVGHVGQVAGDAQGWDTSFVGFIFDTPKTLKECMGDDVTDEQIEEALRGEVNYYASYLEGDVSGYVVEDGETDFHESCGGFIGNTDGAECEMYEALEQALVKRIAEETERAYWLAREVLTD